MDKSTGLGSDYGVRVQIKALQGHPFVILEDSNDKKHEIPAPDPLQFIADDSITTTSDERTSSAANSDDDDDEEDEGGVGDNVEEDEDNQQSQKLNTPKPNRQNNHQHPTAAAIEEPGYQAAGYQAAGYQATGYQVNGYQANGHQTTTPIHLHRQQPSSLDERNSVDNRSKASSQDNNNKENNMYNSQNNNLQSHHPQSNYTQNSNNYPQNQNYDHQNHQNQQHNQQPQNQHQPQHQNHGNQYHQNQAHAPRNNNISVYDERSRSSSGNQQANTARTVTPNIKRSGSSVNVVTRKSAVGTVFALTTSSTKISESVTNSSYQTLPSSRLPQQPQQASSPISFHTLPRNNNNNANNPAIAFEHISATQKQVHQVPLFTQNQTYSQHQFSSQGVVQQRQPPIINQQNNHQQINHQQIDHQQGNHQKVSHQKIDQQPQNRYLQPLNNQNQAQNQANSSHVFNYQPNPQNNVQNTSFQNTTSQNTTFQNTPFRNSSPFEGLENKTQSFENKSQSFITPTTTSENTTLHVADIITQFQNAAERMTEHANTTATPLPNGVSHEDLRVIRKENTRLEDDLNTAKVRIDHLEELIHEQNKIQGEQLLKNNDNIPTSTTSTEDDLKYQQMTRQVARLKERVALLEKQKLEIEEELDKRETDMVKLRKCLQDEQENFDSEIDEVRRDFEKREKQWKSDLENTKDELYDERKRAESNIGKVSKQRVFELEEELDKSADKNDQLMAEIRKLKEHTRQLGQDISDTSKKLGITEARCLELEQKNEKAYELEIEAQQRIEELELRLDHQNLQAKRHDEDLESVYRDVEAAKLEKIALAERVDQLERERQDLGEQIEMHQNDKQSMTCRIKDVEEKQEELIRSRDALATEAQHLHDKRAQLEAEIRDSDMDGKEMGRRVEIVIDQKKALEKQIDDLKITQTKSDQERLTLNSSLREAQWQRDAQQRKIIGLEFQVRRRDKEIERLQHYVQQKNNQKSSTSLNECPPSPKSDRLNKTLNFELERSREEALEQTKTITELEQRNQHLQGELKRAENELEQELREKTTGELEIRKIEKELQENKDQRLLLEKQNKELFRMGERLKTGVNQQHHRLEDTDTRNICLETENSRLVRKVEDMESKIRAMKNEISGGNIRSKNEVEMENVKENIIKEYQTRLHTSESLNREEKVQLENRLMEAERRISSLNLDCSRAKNETEDMVRKLNLLKRDLSELEVEKDQVSRQVGGLQKQLDGRNTEVDTLELRIHEIQQKHIGATVSRNNDGKVEIQKLENENLKRVVEEQKRKFERQLNNLMEEMEDSREGFEQISKNLNQKSGEYEESKIELADAEDLIHELKLKIKEVENEAKNSAKTRSKKSSTDSDSLRSHTQDLIKKQLEGLNEVITNLQKKLKDSDETKMDLEDDMLDLKSKLKKSEREKIMLENEKINFEENAKQFDDKFQKMELELNLAQSKVRNEDNESVSSFTTDMSNMDSLAGMTKTDLKHKIRDLNTDLIEIKEREKSPQLAMNAEIQALKMTLEDREKALRNAEDTIFKQKDVIEELTTIQQSAEKAVIHELKTYQSESELQFVHLRDQLTESEQTRKAVDKSIEKLEREHDEALHAVNALRQERDLLMERVDQLEARLEEADSLSKDLREKFQMITRQKDYLENQLMDIQERTEGLNDEKDEKSEQLHSLVAQKDVLLDTVETIKNELQNAKGQGVQLKNNKANLEAECELLREKVMELEQEIMIVEDQKELSAEHKSKGKLEKVLSELMSEQKAKEELERQLDYAENQIEELENQLDGVDDQHREREDIIHELQEAKQKLQSAEKSAQKSVDEQKKLQEKLRAAIKEAEGGARNMQDEKRLISLQLKQLHAQMADKDDQIDKLKAEKRQGSMHLNEIEQLKNSHAGEVNQLKAQLALIGGEEDDMLTEV